MTYLLEEEIMGKLNSEAVIEATGGRMIGGKKASFTGVCIDSRKIEEGELFIAIKGERFDGHDFLADAMKKGSGAVVSTLGVKPVGDKPVILVGDTLKALQGIAHHLRSEKDIPVVAVTGTNGKTTTKELIAAVLSTRYRVMKNAGNLNNHIGLPLSLTKMDDEEMIVLEMGASAPGEIRTLCEIASPGYGVFTNIGPAHLEGFKDIATVRKTKLELLETVGSAVVNADDPFMMEGVYQSGFAGKLTSYGIRNPSDVYATDVRLRERGSSFVLHVSGDESVEINPRVSGMFNIYNVLAAAAVGRLFGIGALRMRDALDSFAGVPMRLDIREVNGVRVISDVYNANPASMEEAVRELARVRRGRAIAVLGDMLELGGYEEEAHRRLGRLMSGLQIDIFLAVGPRMAFAASEFSGEIHTLESASEAGRLLRSILKEGDVLLIKGSRGMGMEKVMEAYAL